MYSNTFRNMCTRRRIRSTTCEYLFNSQLCPHSISSREISKHLTVSYHVVTFMETFWLLTRLLLVINSGHSLDTSIIYSIQHYVRRYLWYGRLRIDDRAMLSFSISWITNHKRLLDSSKTLWSVISQHMLRFLKCLQLQVTDCTRHIIRINGVLVGFLLHWLSTSSLLITIFTDPTIQFFVSELCFTIIAIYFLFNVLVVDILESIDLSWAQLGWRCPSNTNQM